MNFVNNLSVLSQFWNQMEVGNNETYQKTAKIQTAMKQQKYKKNLNGMSSFIRIRKQFDSAGSIPPLFKLMSLSSCNIQHEFWFYCYSLIYSTYTCINKIHNA